MHSRDKKLAVLHQLSEEADPISLQDLIVKLGRDYSERSTRRWLNEMVDGGVVEKLGRKRATKYKAIERTNGGKKRATSCFGSESAHVIEQVRRPLFERKPSAYDDNWFDSYKPNVTFYIPEKYREQLYRAGKRSNEQDIAGTYAHKIFERLLIDLSYNSSRLEGNTYSLLDTKRLLLEGASAKGKLDEEKIMILNHKEAIRYLVDAADRINISNQTVFTLHYLLSDGLVEAPYAGKVRDHGVRIGGSTYIPFEDPKRLQFQLERITKTAALIEDFYEQSLFLLAHISYLQAFADINKRTARLSANIPLVVNNLVPQSFNDVERDDYTSAIIAIYELQDVRSLVDLYVFSYMRTCAMYDSTIKAMGFDEIRVRYRQQRRAIVRDVLLKELVGTVMLDYVSSEARSLISFQDQEAFIEDVLEDLEEMDLSRIAGLGCTPAQVQAWIKKYRSS